ncbi:universal stress protein [Defluviimonas sp. WL0050]|uniref:Universal stress protein n=1 Tax=Albidovulum litorale TaxID=2984134 RepID=A0ABT2ZTG5_9RHOB|nr:universal stress protein [Defluviimonas sp. WL0050]MCV2874312.1 universal stress protein [Defluviimonas sp. WL0050]
MTNTVLVAIDLSHPEHHADILTRAQKLAGMDGASLAVVTVIPDFGMSIVGTYFSEDAEKRALKEAATSLHAAISGCLGAPEDKNITHIVRHGTAYQEILATADEVGASLIVIGAHRPDFRDYFLGPNAARVVRHAKCSVYVIRS